MRPVKRNTRAVRPRYRPARGLGYFINLLGKMNRWIDRENKQGMDIPRFTRVQLRRIALYLENHHLFNFNALRRGSGRDLPVGGDDRGSASALEAGSGPAPLRVGRPTWDDQVREFKRIVLEENRKFPPDIVEELL